MVKPKVAESQIWRANTGAPHCCSRVNSTQTEKYKDRKRDSGDTSQKKAGSTILIAKSISEQSIIEIKKVFESVAVRWMNLESFIQSEVSQRRTNIVY